MPLVRIQFRPGINKETTTYANEGGFYSCDKVRFRTGAAEKIGGWINYSYNYTYIGVARNLHNWVTYSSENLLGIGTNQKFYVENGGQYYDITPIRNTNALASNPFATTTGSKLITVTDAAYASGIGTYVTFSGASVFNGVTLNGSFEIIATPTSTTYNIIAPTVASGTGSGGGAAVTAVYQINAGNAVYSTGSGWGIPPWGSGGWGSSTNAGIPMQLWSQFNNNQDLMMAIRGGAIYYWVKDTSAYTPAVTLNAYAGTLTKVTYAATFGSGVSTITVPNSLGIDIGAIVAGTNIPAGTYVTTAYTGGASVPISNATSGVSSGNYTFSYSGNTAPNETNLIFGSNIYSFAIAMGSTPYDPTNFNPTFDPMRVRWSDQSNAAEWTPTTSNQAGEQRLSNGSYIVSAEHARQEILIWTDTALYSMQYIGPPYVFGFTPLMDNISIISPNAAVTVNNVTYWMGADKFYVYSGTVATLPCSLRNFVFKNINTSQAFQVVCGYNERYNEIWWFYPSTNSLVNDSYIIYNFMEEVWYNGSLNRTAWLDSPLRPYPMAAFSIQTSYLGMAIGTTDITISLLNGSSYLPSGTITIDSEQITYTGITGNNLTGCIRGVNNTVAASHVQYSTVSYNIQNQIMLHENGVDDASMTVPQPIDSYIESSDVDIAGGENFAFVWRILPDFNFTGSTVANPQLMLTVKPRQNSGTPYLAGVDTPSVTSSSTYPVELYTGEVFTRVRGRQMAVRIESTNLGVQWQLGALRFGIRPDGRKS